MPSVNADALMDIGNEAKSQGRVPEGDGKSSVHNSTLPAEFGLQNTPATRHYADVAEVVDDVAENPARYKVGWCSVEKKYAKGRPENIRMR